MARNGLTGPVPIPVSYTHLLCYGVELPEHEAPERLLAAIYHWCLPVSYTHLDVYKRQG